MAKFLDTMEITSSLQRILKNAKEWVILISPYIDICQRYKSLIQEKNEEHVSVTIVWGKKKKQFKFDSEIKNWIKSMEFAEDIFYKDLHAKCYLNENEAIITSMNLYEASQKNVEMGVLLTKQKDGEAYDELWKEVKRLIKNKPNLIFIQKKSDKKEGFCIRCKEPIKLDPSHPYCKKDYDNWKKFEDENYKEKNGVCHICGKPLDSSMKKPVCKDCYKKNKELFKNKKPLR
jgi:phosphatidylserine/phosphatidylglycerophosphate/cardiolipin synthase-like enzyme